MNRVSALWLAMLAFVLAACNLNRAAIPPTWTPPPTNTPWIAGDLGPGSVHGKLTDALSGLPIQNASIQCQHHSYTSPQPCQGTTTSDENGEFAFEPVFFHDTDQIILTIQADGYQDYEYREDFFTSAELTAEIALVPAGSTPFPVCTAPACPSDYGELVCGKAGGCPGGCGTVCKPFTPTPYPQASDTPFLMCTAPACPSGTGKLVCGKPGGCTGGCGTICATFTPTPYAVCTAPACPSNSGKLVCGNPGGCPGGCGTICATFTPAQLHRVKTLLPVCTAPACPSGTGKLVCGKPGGCTGGCGTICATFTPTP